MSLNICKLDQEKYLIRLNKLCDDDYTSLLVQIKNFIEKENCENLVVDLCGLNIIYATQLGILASTYHFLNYHNGKINVIVDCDVVKTSIDKLKLANSRVYVKQNNVKKIYHQTA